MNRYLLGAAVAAVAFAAPTISMAATAAYQAAVNLNSPYAAYRFGETSIADGTVAADSSGNARNGEYNGTPVGGVVGQGLLSDTAAAFAQGSGTTSQYMAAPLQGFGALVGTSTYEFVFKINNPGATAVQQSLFGTFSPSATPMDVEVTLNSRGNDAGAGGTVANATRLYIKGTDADAQGGYFINPTLYDGNYHHLVYTFNASQTGVAAFQAYVDGVAQTMLLDQVGSSATDADADPDGFTSFSFPETFAGRNVRGTAIDGNGVGRLANVTLDEAALYGTVLDATTIAAHATAAGFVVPEPTTLAALSLGGLMLGRRRKA